MDGNDVNAFYIDDLDFNIDRGIAVEFCCRGDQLDLGFFAGNTNDRPIIVNPEQQQSSACIGKGDHLAGDLLEVRKLSLELQRVALAKLDDLTEFLRGHSCQKSRWARRRRDARQKKIRTSLQ